MDLSKARRDGLSFGGANRLCQFQGNPLTGPLISRANAEEMQLLYIVFVVALKTA
jgi:hypothetical protein